MSKAGVLIWLVIALVLGGAAIWLLRAPATTAATTTGPVITAPMARIVELTVIPAGAAAQRVIRDPVSGDWNLAGPGGDWPVQIGNIQGALRLLATLEGRDAEGSATPPGTGDAEVRLTLDDGTAWTLWLAERSLGGERLARVQPPDNAPGRTVLVDASLFEALITTGPAAWRVPLAISDLTTDVSRITLTAIKGRVILGRVNGRWALQEPVSAPADDSAVQALLRTLSGVRVARFLDSPPDPVAAGFDSPIATATLVSDRRVPRGDDYQTITTTRILTVGGPASIDGKELFARVRRESVRPGQPSAPASEALVTIGRESLDPVSMDATTYLSPAAVATHAGEVGSVTILTGKSPRTYRRTVDGWDADAPLKAPNDRERIESLLKLLCESEPAGRILHPPPTPPLATIRLDSLGGSPLAEVSLGLSESLGRPEGEQGPARVFVVSGDVARLYEAAPWADLLDWITTPPTR